MTRTLPLPVFPFAIHIRLLLWAMLVVTMPALSTERQSDPNHLTIDTKLEEPESQIDLARTKLESLEQLAIRRNVCGVVVAIIKNRKLVSFDSASGCEEAKTLDSNSIFQAASLSKPVFAYAVLKLAEQGKLDLDLPVSEYLQQGYRHSSNPFKAGPSLADPVITDPRLKKVTARMILNHTSGLPNWANGPLSFDFEPGEKWGYSGEGYLLLQRVVETVTGQPLDQFMAEQVFKPFNMNHSDYIWQPRFERNLVPTYSAEAPVRFKPFLFPVSAATLYTSAQDYGKFFAALLSDEKIVKQIVAAPVTVESKLHLDWGLGWGIENRGDDIFIWQWGNNPGYRAFAIASVRTGDGFVMLTNSENGLALAKPIADKLMPGPHEVFQFYMLRDGLAYFLCQTLHLCH